MVAVWSRYSQVLLHIPLNLSIMIAYVVYGAIFHVGSILRLHRNAETVDFDPVQFTIFGL